MKLYQVWMEGYATNGDSGKAVYQGSFEADTFADACMLWSERVSQRELFNADRLTYWGCRLFDNEHDARKSFG